LTHVRSTTSQLAYFFALQFISDTSFPPLKEGILSIIVPETRVLLANQNNPINLCVPGGVYTELTPVTGNTAQIYPNVGTYPQVAFAIWRLLVTVPTQNALLARLSTADDGPSNINPIAYIGGENYHWLNLGPDKVTNEALDFTAAMNAALTSKTTAEWQLYWQFSGNNTDTVGFWGCRIDFGWIVG
jgi:hypothetical protein